MLMVFIFTFFATIALIIVSHVAATEKATVALCNLHLTCFNIKLRYIRHKPWLQGDRPGSLPLKVSSNHI